MKSVGVVGGGIMGCGIAQCFAQACFSVVLVEKDRVCAQRAQQTLKQHLQLAVKKGVFSQADSSQILSRVHTTTQWNNLKKVSFVVEAVPENEELKKQVFAKLDQKVQPKVILASNTSSLSITQLAGSTQRSDRVIGMHFMNPAPVMPLVEVVKGLKTSSLTLKQTLALVRQLKKTPVVSKDSPGFISNRILASMLNEAIFCLMEGVGTKKDIDAVMKLGLHHPMGPLELADYIGLDTLLAILNVLHQELGNPKYRPAPLLVKMVRAGLLGKKSGQGFYKYGKPSS